MGADLDPIRVLAHAHGHLGWLSAIALVHPAILLRRERRRADLSVTLAVLFVSCTTIAGALVYGAYRERVKQQIFLHAPRIGWLFERKEHLAFGALMLAWAGALAYLAETRVESSLRSRLRRSAHLAFVLAAGLAIAVAAAGTIVASYRPL